MTPAVKGLKETSRVAASVYACERPPTDLTLVRSVAQISNNQTCKSVDVGKHGEQRPWVVRTQGIVKEVQLFVRRPLPSLGNHWV